MTQTARPMQDISEGGWTPTPLWQQIGGAMPNTTTPITSSNNPNNDTFEVKLSTLAIPGPGTQTLTVQLCQTTAGEFEVLLALVQGSQVIASKVVQPTASFANYTLTLSQQQIGQITSTGYSDLRVRVTAGVLQVTPDIFSATVSYFGDGANYPAGTYLVQVVGGALSYNTGISLQWYINYMPGVFGYEVVYNDGAATVNGPGDAIRYDTDTACSMANAGASVTITHTGGKIGVYLRDNPYSDNGPGPNIGAPTFQLVGTDPLA